MNLHFPWDAALVSASPIGTSLGPARFPSRTAALILVFFLSSVCLGESPFCENERESDERTLAKAGISNDDACIRSLLRKLLPPELTASRVQELTAQLASTKFQEREAATKMLIGFGPMVLAPLREALARADAETSKRLNYCIEQIEALHPGNTRKLLRAGARSLVRVASGRSQEFLIECLAAAFDPEVERDIWFALDALASRQRKVESPITKALKHPEAIQRAAAGFLNGRYGDETQQELAVSLLKDRSPLVRLRTAQGLVAGRKGVGVETLVDLVAEADLQISLQAEELLIWLAVDNGPDLTLTNASRSDREKSRRAWREWWKKRKMDLLTLPHERAPRYPGLYLIQFWNDYYLLSVSGCQRWIQKSRLGKPPLFPAAHSLHWLNPWLEALDREPAVTTRDGDLTPVFHSTFDGLILRWDSKRERVVQSIADAQPIGEVPANGLQIQYAIPIFDFLRLGLQPMVLDHRFWLQYRLADVSNKSYGRRAQAVSALNSDFCANTQGNLSADRAFEALLANALDSTVSIPLSVAFEDAIFSNLTKSRTTLYRVVHQRLSDSRPECRALAVVLIPRLERDKQLTPSDTGVGLVVPFLRDRDPMVCRQAASAVAACRGPGEKEVLALVKALEDDDRSTAAVPQFGRIRGSVVERAAKALESLAIASPAVRPLLKESLPQLCRLVVVDNERVQLASLRTLTEIARTDAATIRDVMPTYQRLLRSASKIQVREQCAMDVGLFGPNGAAAVSELLKLWEVAEGPSTRQAVLIGLEGVGPGAVEVIELLVQVVESSTDERELIRAIETLGKIGPKAAVAIPALKGKSTTANTRVRAHALEALTRIEKK